MLSLATVLVGVDSTSRVFSTNPVEFVIRVDEVGAGVIPGGFYGFVGAAQARNGETDPAELTERLAIAHGLLEAKRAGSNLDNGLQRDDWT